MSQEITVIVMIDVPAAIAAGKLDGNIYLIDNLRTEGSEGEGTGHLVTAVNGSYWADGSQADEALLNWLPYGIGGVPYTVPKSFFRHRPKSSDVDSVIHSVNENVDTKRMLVHKLHEAKRMLGASAKVRDARGRLHDLGTRVMNAVGEPIAPNQGGDGGTPSLLTYLTPQLDAITGEAVDKGIIYPAQYGTPISVKDGWYWSATADTALVGEYGYTLHFTLYDLSYDGEEPVWSPVRMSYDAKLKVTTQPKLNGFTNAGMGYLPVA